MATYRVKTTTLCFVVLSLALQAKNGHYMEIRAIFFTSDIFMIVL